MIRGKFAGNSLVLLALVFLAGAGEVWGQGYQFHDIVLNSRGQPLGGVNITVCTSAGVGSPCTPTATIYSDSALTIVKANPFLTDGLGNFSFYAAPGKYTYSITGATVGAGGALNTITLPCVPNSTCPGVGVSVPLTTRGDLLTMNSVPALSRLALGTNGQVLTSNGLDTVWATPSAGGGLGSNNIWTGDQLFKSGRPVYDVMAYGASGSNQSTTGSITSGQPTLTLGAAIDFVNGQGIAVYGAGPLSALAAPTGCSATPTVTTFYVPAGNVVRAANVVTIKYTTPHFYAVGQSITLAGMSDASLNGTFTIASKPDAWTTTHAQVAAGTTGGSGTVVLAAGAAANTYRMAAIDASGGLSAPSAAVSTTTSQSTLSASGFNRVKCNAVTGAIGYAVYGRTGAITAIAMARREDIGEATSQYDDFGFSYTPPAYVPNALPAGATNQVLLTTISSGGGTTTLTLAANASATAAAVAVQHDDTAAIQAAQNAARNLGGTVYFPIGIFNFWNVDIRTLGTPGSWTVWKFDGDLSPRIPLNIGSYVALVGGMQLGPTTPFGYPGRARSAVFPNALNPVIAIRGLSNPSYLGNLFIAGHTYDGIRLSSKDAANVVDNSLIENVATISLNQPAGAGLRIDNGATGVGGFGYTIRDSSFSITGGTGAVPAIWVTTAAIGQVSNSIVIGGGIRFDGANFVAGGINGKWEFTNIETESLPTPFFMVDGTGGAAEQFTFNFIELADNIFSTNSLICNLASQSVVSFVVINSRGWGSAGLLSGDNILGVTVLGGITDSGASGNAGIGTGTNLAYTIIGHGGQFIVNTVSPGAAVFGAASPITGISTAFQQTDSNTIPAAVRGLSSTAVNLFEVQDSAGNPLVGMGRLAASDRLRIYAAGGSTFNTRFDSGGDLVLRNDGLTAGLATQAFLTVGAFASVPGIIIGPASGSQDSFQVFRTGSSTQKLFSISSTGIGADGDGFKHSRATAGCATAAAAGATCDTTVSWTTSFVDVNYTPTCDGLGITSGVPTNGGIVSKATGNVVFRTVAITAAAAQFTNISCAVPHD